MALCPRSPHTYHHLAAHLLHALFYHPVYKAWEGRREEEEGREREWNGGGSEREGGREEVKEVGGREGGGRERGKEGGRECSQ